MKKNFQILYSLKLFLKLKSALGIRGNGMIRIKSENRTLGANLWKGLDSTKMHLSGFLVIKLARESRDPALAPAACERERERGELIPRDMK